MTTNSSSHKSSRYVEMANKESFHHYDYCGKGIGQLIESYVSDQPPFITSHDLKFPEIDFDSGIIRELKSVFFPNYWNRGSDYNPSNKALLETQLNNLGALLFEGHQHTLESILLGT